MEVRFDDIFKLSCTSLYWNQGHPSIPLNLRCLAKITLFYAIYTPVFASLLYSNFYDKFTKICTNTSIAVLYCIISFNYGLLIYYKKRFTVMIKIVEDDICRSRELIAEDEKVVKEYTTKGLQASKFFSAICMLSGFMFFCKAVVGTSYSAIVRNFKPVFIHELTYPAYIDERKYEFQVYFALFVGQLFYIVLTVLMYAGFNPLGPIFILHACGQIQLAIREVKTPFLKQNVDTEETLKIIKNVARKIQHIYSFVDQIQQTHRLLYEMCLKTSAIVIPVACFGIIESYNEGSISIDLICYVFAAGMQCSIPCYYCETLLSKGEELRVAVYECGWERHWMPRTRSLILLMLASTTRPLGIRAVFSTVSLEAFTDVMNQAYKLFNVLNAARI